MVNLQQYGLGSWSRKTGTAVPEVSESANAQAQSADSGHTPPTPSLLHVAVLSSVILTSVALLPYLVIRNRLALLQGQVAQAGSVNAAVHRHVKMLLAENSNRGHEQRRLLELLKETKSDVERLKSQAECSAVASQDLEVKTHEDLQDLKRMIAQAEAEAVKREQARTEWLRNFFSKFTWPKK